MMKIHILEYVVNEYEVEVDESELQNLDSKSARRLLDNAVEEDTPFGSEVEGVEITNDAYECLFSDMGV